MKRGKRGRPEFKATPTLKRLVSVSAGGGMAHEEIALSLGISRPTLEKHFVHELSVGAYKRRTAVLDAMYRAATAKDKPNVSAGKAYLALTPRASAPPHPGGDKPKEPKIGKKDQAQADAGVAQVGSEWETILPGGTQLQ